MVATSLSSTPGISGTGKTVAATPAITAVANERGDEAFVLLQGNLNQRLRAFFRLTESLTDDIAEPFFTALQRANTQLHLIFDNVLERHIEINRKCGQQAPAPSNLHHANPRSCRVSGEPARRHYSHCATTRPPLRSLQMERREGNGAVDPNFANR